MAALARFVVVFACGLAAAASIGKLVPHAKWMASEFEVSLGAAGFAVSAVMLAGALLGPFLGLTVDRLGAKRVALLGLGIEAAASLAAARAASFEAVIAGRLIEGIGYSLAIVAATVLVVETSAGTRRALALAVWSAFAPLGFALGQWLAGSVEDPNPLPLVGTGHALILGGVLLVLAIALPRSAQPSEAGGAALFLGALRYPPALRTSLAFGCATAALLGAVALAPLALAPASGLSVAATAQFTALAALPGILGRFASGWLLGAATRPITVFVAASLAGCLLLAVGLAAPLSFAAALACFAGFQICVGALPGVMSAMLPLIAPSPAQLGTTSGLVNQMITAGNLFAPPLVLAVYAAAGVGGALIVLALGVALSLALVGSLEVYHKPLTTR